VAATEHLRAREALDSFADACCVGVLVALAALPGITLFAALAAGGTTLAPADGDGRSLPARYWNSLRDLLGQATRVQLVWTVPLAVGLFDVVAAGAVHVGSLQWLVRAVGAAIVIASLALLPYLISALDPATPAGVGACVRSAVVHAGIRPLLTVGLLLVTVTVAVAVLAAPVLTPIVLGGYLLSAGAIARRTRSHVAAAAQRFSAHHPRRNP